MVSKGFHFPQATSSLSNMFQSSLALQCISWPLPRNFFYLSPDYHPCQLQPSFRLSHLTQLNFHLSLWIVHLSHPNQIHVILIVQKVTSKQQNVVLIHIKLRNGKSRSRQLQASHRQKAPHFTPQWLKKFQHHHPNSNPQING